MVQVPAKEAGAVARANADKYLIFTLGHESYGIAQYKIRDIVRPPNLTPLPGMPRYIKGMLEWGGKHILVLDLRIKFGLGETVSTEQTRIIVVQMVLATRSVVQVGVLVDAIEETLSISPEEIDITPDLGAKLDTCFLLGMVRVEGTGKNLLDIDLVVERDSLQALGQTLPAGCL